MSMQYGQLCSLIVFEHFGEVVQTVVEDLFKVGCKTLNHILATTKLKRSQVIECLRVLIHFGMVTYKPSQQHPNIPEYTLWPEKILLLLRYARYMLVIKTLLGDEAELIVEEILRYGTDRASAVIVRATSRLKELRKEEKNVTVASVRDKLVILMNKQFVMRCAEPLGPNEMIPLLTIKEQHLFLYPELNLRDLVRLEQGIPGDAANDVNLRVNFDRFHREFRDQVMITAIKRRIDDNAGELMRILLHQMYIRTDAWVPTSNPIPAAEIRASVFKLKSSRPQLSQYLDQYLKVLVEDPGDFVMKSSDGGGGQYVVDVKEAFVQLSWATVENIVEERFGSKAARVFRIIKAKKFIEQEQLQQHALIPAKEAKLITYKLMQERFIQIQELRKSLTAGGPNKTFFLFHIDIDMVVRKCVEICYKAIFNSITRRHHETNENRRLIDKQQRISSLIANLREQNAPEESITELADLLTPLENETLERVKIMVARFGEAEFRIDDNLFTLQLFLMYLNTK